jgi:hypothetical protein
MTIQGGGRPLVTDHVIDETAVVETVRAIEAADEPLNPKEWPALADRRLREAVNERLSRLGRQLIEVTDGRYGSGAGFISGWSDQAASVLQGMLPDLNAEDLAVLALAYLHTVVLEGVFGEQVVSIQEQFNAHRGPDGRDVISADQLGSSLARLRARQLLDGRSRPGPALMRLSTAQRHRLEDNLVLLCRPDSALAREIRAQRQRGSQPGGDG